MNIYFWSFYEQTFSWSSISCNALISLKNRRRRRWRNRWRIFIPNDIIWNTFFRWRFHMKMNTFKSNDFITLDRWMIFCFEGKLYEIYLNMFTFVDSSKIKNENFFSEKTERFFDLFVLIQFKVKKSRTIFILTSLISFFFIN